jgi:uncharacterized small protein (DUF1192 family)
LAEERKETHNEDITAQSEAAFAPVKKTIDDKIALIQTEIERLKDERNSMPNTREGFVQKQIGQLAIMIREQEKGMWQTAKWLWQSAFDQTFELNNVKSHIGPVVRKEAVEIVEEWLKSIEASKAKAPTLSVTYIQ